MLVIECDSNKLASQSLTTAREIFEVVRPFATDASFVAATSEPETLKALGELSARNWSASTVVLVAHSNLRGLQLTRERSCTWRALCEWLRPFEPRALVVVGCQAGRLLPCRELFDGLPALKDIYGSPQLVNQEQVKILRLFVPFHVMGGKLSPEAKLIAQGVNFATTGGLLFHRTRKSVMSSSNLEVLIETGIEEVIKRMLR